MLGAILPNSVCDHGLKYNLNTSIDRQCMQGQSQMLVPLNVKKNNNNKNVGIFKIDLEFVP